MVLTFFDHKGGMAAFRCQCILVCCIPSILLYCEPRYIKICQCFSFWIHFNCRGLYIWRLANNQLTCTCGNHGCLRCHPWWNFCHAYWWTLWCWSNNTKTYLTKRLIFHISNEESRKIFYICDKQILNIGHVLTKFWIGRMALGQPSDWPNANWQNGALAYWLKKVPNMVPKTVVSK